MYFYVGRKKTGTTVVPIISPREKAPLPLPVTATPALAGVVVDAGTAAPALTGVVVEGPTKDDPDPKSSDGKRVRRIRSRKGTAMAVEDEANLSAEIAAELDQDSTKPKITQPVTVHV